MNLELLECRIAPAVFSVNNLNDYSLSPGVDPSTGEITGTGIVTLRSAIEAANETPGSNTINLTVAGTYQIMQAGSDGEEDNVAGEFAITSIDLATGQPTQTSLTIENSSGGSVVVDGNNLSRVFDINPQFSVGNVNITAGGSGFVTGTSGITFDAPSIAGGVQATGTLDISAGTVIGVDITNPGSGYTTEAPPTFSFTGPGANAAGNLGLNTPTMNVTMSGFTIEHGLAQPGDDATGSGGGIRDQGDANLTLNGMVITNNNATADGGGVGMTDLPGSTFWTLTLNNTTVSNNHAGDAGGGIDTDGGGTVLINAGSVISGNTDFGQGAGVYIDAEGDAVQTIGVTNGGAGYTSAPLVNIGGPGTGAEATAIMVNGMVSAVNIVNGGTGYVSAPTISFVGGNPTTPASATAAVTSFQSASMTMTNSLVSYNNALQPGDQSSGGGISNAGNGTMDINQSTIEYNSTEGTGGGFSDENNVGTLIVSNSLFLGNTASDNGGGLQEGGPSTTITNSEFKNNSTNNSGGAIFVNGPTLAISNSTISNNTALGNGAGIEIQTSGSGASGSTITNTTISGNSAVDRSFNTFGGGIDAPAQMIGSLTLLNVTINGNYAANGGGVYYAGPGGSSFSAQNTIIAANVVSTGGAGPDANNPSGTFTDLGNNLIGVVGSGNTGFTSPSTDTGTVSDPLNPLLGPLQNNGGPTVGASGTAITLETESPESGSPAIAEGNVADAPTTDERSFTSIVNGQINVGASSAGLFVPFVHSQYATAAYDYTTSAYTYAYDAYVTGTGSFTTYFYAYYAMTYAYDAYYYDSIQDKADSEFYAYYAYVYGYDAYFYAYNDFIQSGQTSTYSFAAYEYSYYGWNYSYNTATGL